MKAPVTTLMKSDICGIMHAHSTYSSDGEMTLRQLADWCRENGLGFLMISEHPEIPGRKIIDRARMREIVKECEELSDENFLVIPGLEFLTEDGMHILAYGIREYFEERDTKKSIDKIHELGGLAVLAHVSIYGKIPFEKLSGIDGVEVWNTAYDGWLAPRPGNIRILGKVKGAKAFAGSDLHREEQLGRMLVCVKAGKFEEKEILNALKRGDARFRGRFVSLDPDNIRFYHRLIFPFLNRIYDFVCF